MRIEMSAKDTYRSLCFEVLICLLLATAIFIVYWQVIDFDFISLDDPYYIINNPSIRHGINFESLKWAFSSFGYEANWHPLTWISHMLDIQLFGMNPGMHHFTNVIFHILNSMLLFIVLEKMTGALWRSAVVAVLFALHPLHVESVAWISERKDVLSTFFWMLTMMGYLWYVHHPSVRRYLTVIFFYILGLLSKPMLVTLPFVLLLLDYWPLNRLDLDHTRGVGKNYELNRSYEICWSRIPRLIVEKIPMIVLAIISSSLTIIAQHEGGALKSFKIFPFSLRILNAITSYVDYLWKVIYIFNLVVFYPYKHAINPLVVILFCLFLIFVTVLAVLCVKRLPYFLVGWFWYLGTLIPVIGLVQVGVQPMADRYTYIPLIGIFILIVWGISELLEKFQIKKIILITVAGVVLPILISFSWIQVGYWKNSKTLYEHTINVPVKNYIFHLQQAKLLMDQGDLDGAEKHCAEALRINSDYQARMRINPDQAYNFMGKILKNKGEISKAIIYLSKAIQLNPTYADAYNSLGVAFMYQGRFSDAIKMFSKVLDLEPENVSADVNMGSSLKSQGRVNEAIHYFKKALQIRPDLLVAHYYLGEVLSSQGKIDESIEQYKRILKIDPSDMNAQVILNNLKLMNKK